MVQKTSKKSSPSSRRGTKGAESTVSGGRDASGLVDGRLERLKELVRILEASSLAELQYEDEDIVVGLSRHGNGAATSMLSPAGLVLPAPVAKPVDAAPAPAAVAPIDESSLHVVRSPFVGTFYAAPSPEAEPFTGVDKRVRRGQTLCIIEAMKLMNEIESEVDGLVVEVVAENGKPVQYGDPLFKIQVK